MKTRTLIILAMWLVPGLSLADLTPLNQTRNLDGYFEINNTAIGDYYSDGESDTAPDFGEYDAWIEPGINFQDSSCEIHAWQISRITPTTLEAIVAAGGYGESSNPDVNVLASGSSYFEVSFELDAPHEFFLYGYGWSVGPGSGGYWLVDEQGATLSQAEIDPEGVEVNNGGMLPAGTYFLIVEAVLDMQVEGEGWGESEAEFDLVLELTPVGTSGVGDALATGYLRAGPNPMTDAAEIAFAIGRGGPVSIEVLDIRGHRVRIFVAGGGEGRVRWDGRTATGRQAPSGTYFLRARSGQQSLQSKVTLVR